MASLSCRFKPQIERNPSGRLGGIAVVLSVLFVLSVNRLISPDHTLKLVCVVVSSSLPSLCKLLSSILKSLELVILSRKPFLA